MTTVLSNSLFWIVAAAILGFVIAWLIKGAKEKQLQHLQQEKETALAKLEQEHNSFVDRFKDLQRTNNKLRTDAKASTAELAHLKEKAATLEKQTAIKTVAATPTPSVKVHDNSYEIRAWESKYARLERNLADRNKAYEELKEANDALRTKMEVLAARTEDALQDREDALDKVKTYESYRPRFEEANLERNAMKFKYEELLNSKGSFDEKVAAVEAQRQALEVEVAQLKEQLEKSQSQIATYQSANGEVRNLHQKMERDYQDIKIKYDSLLGLQLRTEDKIKELEAQLAVS